MSQDDLITLFRTLNIETGNVDSRVIKAWFDTDCEDMLKWLCTNIDEECYLSPQEELEYLQIDVSTREKLDESIDEIIETKFPDVFDVQSNILDIEIAKNTIEMLEEQLKDLNTQMDLNEQLHHNLTQEFRKTSALAIQSRVEEETAYENCKKLSEELDSVNTQTYQQLLKYGFHLANYDFAQFPVFVNHMDVTEYKEKLLVTTRNLNFNTTTEDSIFETSLVKSVVDPLCDLESRIFNSQISCLAFQMETEALNSTLNFLDKFDVDAALSFVDYDHYLLSIETNENQQLHLLKVIEEISQRLAKQYVSVPMLRHLKKELNSFELKHKYLKDIKKTLTKMIVHFIMIHILYLQEKKDIINSSQFFKNISKYVSKNLKDSTFRKEAMLTLISDYNNFSSEPICNKFKVFSDFASIVLNNDNMSMRDILEQSVMIRNVTKEMKKQYWHSFPNYLPLFKEKYRNIKVLEEFLMCGPSSQIVVVPTSLQMLFRKTEEISRDQKSCIKVLLQSVADMKEHSSKNQKQRLQHMLWIYFMTNGTKMLSFLEEVKSNGIHKGFVV